MEENIIISNINDFLFCPRSIYFHNIYENCDEHIYHSASQVKGKISHDGIDKQIYSTRKLLLQGIDVYSEELGIIGKIDLLDVENGILTERKNKIQKIYEGYYLQLYAQYFCLIEMGYSIKSIKFYSVSDNKTYNVRLPGDSEKEKLKRIISSMNSFRLEDKNFNQNPNKCKMCIYKELCDYYDCSGIDDE